MTKTKTFESFLDEIREKYGDVVVSVIKEDNEDLKAIPTGIISLDTSTGIGGIPRSKFTEIYGAESTAKTTLALTLVRSALAMGEKALYIDVENMMDLEYAEKVVGTLDQEKWVILQPEFADAALEMAEKGIESKEFALIILDSIGALAPKKEKEDEFSDANVALVSRLLAKFLRRDAYQVRVNNVAFVFINQVRANIGAYMGGYTTPGGNAIKHYCSLRISLSKGQEIKKSEEHIGQLTKFTIKKNKVGGRPNVSYTFPVIHGLGIDIPRDAITFGKDIGVIKQAGPYFKLDDEVLGRGVKESMQYLTDHPEVLDRIRVKSYNKVNQGEVELPKSEESLED